MEKELQKELQYEEKVIKGGNGMLMLILAILAGIGSCVAFVLGIGMTGMSAAALNSGMYLPEDMVSSYAAQRTFGIILIFASIALCLFCIFALIGLRVVKPNEALVMTLFGKYYGTLKGENFACINPFAVGINPTLDGTGAEVSESKGTNSTQTLNALLGKKKADSSGGKKISLKAITLNNGKQKINDQLGNPIEIGIVVIWRVVNTAKAVFSVDNYKEYLSIQADSALRNIVRLYPYDVAEGGDESSLRGSSQEVAEQLKTEIQNKVEMAGLEVLEARITHLAYAPEIAAAMLQRQQAAAIIDARKMIVDGAVGMVDMALTKLSEKEIVELDEERKAAMVSNLLVVLCGNKDAQPIVNSGSIY